MHPLDSSWQSIVLEFDQAQIRARHESRQETTKQLNQIARRLKNYDTEAEWLDALLDGVSAFTAQTAVFSVEGGSQARLRGARHLELSPDLNFAASAAAGFADALESKDTVVVLRTPAEVGEALAAPKPLPSPDHASAEPAPARCYIVPVHNRTRVAALVFAADGAPAGDDIPFADLNAIELVATLASAVLERIRAKSDLIGISPSAEAAPEPAPKKALPSWADLDEVERNLHIRAQRFARTKVAEMQLYKPDLCQKGVEREDLYLFLKPEIDSAREGFRTQFMTVPSMVDYLHLELSATLAHGDEFVLGPDYPGQMV